MPWDSFELNDGNDLPGIAYTPGQDKGRTVIDGVKRALSLDITSIDTSKLSGNEKEVGQAIKDSRVARSNLFITTKYDFKFNTDADAHTSLRNSLNFLGVSYLDLYLIQRPLTASREGLPVLWRQFEGFQRKGWVKSIGVSNFNIQQLKSLLESAEIKPAVNQILFHPYINPSQGLLIDFCKANGIVVEAYGVLTSITQQGGGPLDKPLAKIAEKRRATSEQILFAWARAKGTAVVTTALDRPQLQNYLDAGDIELTDAEIAIIDVAGKEGIVGPPPFFTES